MLEKQLKKIDIWDISLVKLAALTGGLFLITVSPTLMGLVHQVDWWWFLLAMIVFAARPFYRAWLKK